MFKTIDRLYDKKISSKGLAIFRILFSINLLFEVLYIFKYRQLYYDSIPFIETSHTDYGLLLFIWMLILVMLTLGIFTRASSILNYSFILFFLSSTKYNEYHMDYAYSGISFLMILFPIAKSFSLDNLLLKYKYSNTKKLFVPKEKISVLYYFILIFVGVGIVYLDSIATKIHSDSWTNGLGLWLPASLPQITINSYQWILNQKYLILFLGYLTFAFEMIFPFIFWIKKLRIPLAIIGVSLHIGIFLVFPIPYFGLGIACIYLLLIPNIYWGKLLNFIQYKSPKLFIFYDRECPICVRNKITLKHFDFLNAIKFNSIQEYGFTQEGFPEISEENLLNNHSTNLKMHLSKDVFLYKKAFLYIPIFIPLSILLYIPGISFIINKIYSWVVSKRYLKSFKEELSSYTTPVLPRETDTIKLLNSLDIKKLRIFGIKVLLLLVLFFQYNARFGFPITKKMIHNLTGENFKSIGENIIQTQSGLRNFSTYFFGITPHGVFIDGHFRSYTEYYSLKYNGILLPFTNKFGQPTSFLLGGSWVNFTFRVNKVGINDRKALEKGLVRYSSFWLQKEGINNPEFDIVRKKIKVSFTWEKDLLQNNLFSPWEKVGKLTWKDNKNKFELDQ